MNAKKDFKVGYSVKHVSREYYQRGVVIAIEEGCNGGITVAFEDGFYGGPEEVTLCPQDLAIKQN